MNLHDSPILKMDNFVNVVYLENDVFKCLQGVNDNAKTESDENFK